MFVANFRRQTITKVIKTRKQQQQILNWAFFSRVFQGTLDFSFRTFFKFSYFSTMHFAHLCFSTNQKKFFALNISPKIATNKEK